jgi:pSer/pThr/pTyr-binding forkhead associated (FHA) protein
MAKLVLLVPNGTTLDARCVASVTLGRRADNDVCLPNLAVSGEHAVAVTILSDSFLRIWAAPTARWSTASRSPSISCATAT